MLGQRWHNHRKLLNPSFNSNIVNKFVPIFNKHFKVLVKEMVQYEHKHEFDILPPIKSCTLNMICGKIGLYFVKYIFFNFLEFFRIETSIDHQAESYSQNAIYFKALNK